DVLTLWADASQTAVNRARRSVWSLGTRVSEWLWYLCHILGDPPRSSRRVGERSELLALVVSGPVRAKEHPILGDLHRVGDQAHADDLSRVAVAHPVRGAGEAHRSRGVDLAQDLLHRWWACRGWTQQTAGPSGRHRLPDAAGRGWPPRPHGG